jgi:hypothetical protein
MDLEEVLNCLKGSFHVKMEQVECTRQEMRSQVSSILNEKEELFNSLCQHGCTICGLVSGPLCYYSQICLQFTKIALLALTWKSMPYSINLEIFTNFEENF